MVLLGLKNRAKSKIYISKHANIDYSKLPFNNKVISLISKYRNDGHQVVLATGASKTYANNIAKYLGIFDKVISTVHDINNIGKNKLKFITREVNGDFIYVGDSKNDLPIWRHCKKAILVGNNKTVLQKLKADGILTNSKRRNFQFIN